MSKILPLTIFDFTTWLSASPTNKIKVGNQKVTLPYPVQNREELCGNPIEVDNNLNIDKKDLNHMLKFKRKPYFMEALKNE